MKYFLIDLCYLMAVIAVAAEPDGAGAAAAVTFSCVVILLDLLKRDELPVDRGLVLRNHSLLGVKISQDDAHFIISYASERRPGALVRLIPL